MSKVFDLIQNGIIIEEKLVQHLGEDFLTSRAFLSLAPDQRRIISATLEILIKDSQRHEKTLKMILKNFKP